MSLLNTFINNLRQIRTEKSLTQEKLAEIAEVSTSLIGKIESGRTWPSHTTIDKLATALSIKPYELFMTKKDHLQYNKTEINRVIEGVRITLEKKINIEKNS